MYKKISVALLAVPTLALLTGCTEITPGNVGVIISKAGSSRGVNDIPTRTGFVLYNPMWTQIIEYPYSMQTIKWTKNPNEGSPSDESVTFTTKDSAVVNCDIATSYQIDYEKIPAFYVKFRAEKIDDFTDGYFHNIVRNELNNVGGGYGVEQVMGDNGPMLKQVLDNVQGDLKQYGITVANLGIIGACRPPQVVTDSINAKLAQQQRSLQAQQEVAQAQAEALKREAEADGIAKSNIIIATADGEANRLKSENLTPLILQWKAIDKWNGVQPTVQGGGTPLINLK